MAESDGTRDGMQSVLRSLETLEAIAKMQPVRLSDLSRFVALPKTTVARIVRTLSSAGWIAAESDRGDPRWRLTSRALAVGSTRASGIDVREIARPLIEELGRATDENIHLSSPDGDSMVLIERVASTRSVQTVARVGDRVPMYLTASGWAFLSRLPIEEARSLLPAPEAPGAAVVDTADFFEHLKEAASQGYAVNPGRWRPDVAAIGAAIVNGSGRPVAAVSISMPSYRLSDDLAARYGELVRAATARISAEMAGVTGTSPSPDVQRS